MKDPTVVAIPFYLGSMGAEYLFLRDRQPAGETTTGATTASTETGPLARARDLSGGRYERRDTIASLTMGLGSLVLPLVMPKLLAPLTPGKGRYGKALVVVAGGAAAVTTLADAVARKGAKGGAADFARKIASVGGPAAVVTGGTAFTSSLASRTSLNKMWNKRVMKDLGPGPLALVGAVAGWDFIYYWNHRFMHECRALWAIHVVHHSSERYNLSTALRQPVADAFGAFIPYSLLCLLGIRPSLVNSARGINLLYQYWIHTESIDKLGPIEEALNTPSHHRVHHGSNGRYLDRNHGSILIIWDRLFGTFEPESEKVIYGLTKNLDSFNPAVIATHEHIEMLRDVAASTNWKDRLSFVLRGPGWAARRRLEQGREVSSGSA
ncbi:MAG: sterol desaturase family protein [Acidimicrobiales bacterium]